MSNQAINIYSVEAPTGHFLNIKEDAGGSATVRFFDEPIMWEKETNFNDVKERKTRFATLCLFRNKKTKESEVKIFEFGWAVQKQLRQLANDEDWGMPENYDITINVEGEGLKTKYSVIPRPKKELSDSDKALIKGCSIDLRKSVKADENQEEPDPMGDYSPFDDE